MSTLKSHTGAEDGKVSVTAAADILPACSLLMHVSKIEWDGDLRKVSSFGR